MGAPQFIQSNQDNFAAGSPITCAYTTSNPIKGNLLICAASTGSSATTLSISDTLNGSTWSQILNQVSDSNNYLWAVQNTQTGADTVSIVSSAPADIVAVSILEYSGVQLATDGKGIAALVNGGTQTTPSLTLHFPIELIIAFMRGNSGKATPNSPLNTRAQCTLAGSVYFGVGDRITSSISNPETESFATNGESNHTGAIGIAAFEATTNPLQQATATFTNGAATATLGAAVQSGDSIIVCVSASTTYNLIGVASIADDGAGGGNTYVPVPGSTIYDPATNTFSATWWCASAEAAQNITVTMNAGIVGGITVLEVFGISTFVTSVSNQLNVNPGPTNFSGPALNGGVDATSFFLVNSSGKSGSNITAVASPWTLVSTDSYGANGCQSVSALPSVSGVQQPTFTTVAFEGCLSGIVWWTGPVLTVQPRPTAVRIGQTATFSVTAIGTPTLTYQWFLNGSAIVGATSASYTTGPQTILNNGNKYYVIVSDSGNSVQSSTVTLGIATSSWVGIGGVSLASQRGSR